MSGRKDERSNEEDKRHRGGAPIGRIAIEIFHHLRPDLLFAFDLVVRDLIDNQIRMFRREASLR